MTPAARDPYGISKYAVELDLAAAHEMFGLEYTVFRPHNVYGERQSISDPYRNVIGIFMNALLARPSHAGVRRRPPDPGLLRTSPTSPRSSPGRRSSGRRATRPTTSAPTGPPRSSTWPARWRAPSAPSPASSTSRRAGRSSTRSPTTPRCGPPSSRPSRWSWRRGSRAWRPGCASTARAIPCRLPGRDRDRPRPSAGVVLMALFRPREGRRLTCRRNGRPSLTSHRA